MILSSSSSSLSSSTTQLTAVVSQFRGTYLSYGKKITQKMQLGYFIYIINIHNHILFLIPLNLWLIKTPVMTRYSPSLDGHLKFNIVI